MTTNCQNHTFYIQQKCNSKQASPKKVFFLLKKLLRASGTKSIYRFIWSVTYTIRYAYNVLYGYLYDEGFFLLGLRMLNNTDGYNMRIETCVFLLKFLDKIFFSVVTFSIHKRIHIYLPIAIIL